MGVDEALLAERFRKLASSEAGDWDDVRRRVHRHDRRTAAIVLACAVALLVTGLGLGADLIGVFNPHGKRFPLSSLTPGERDLIVAAPGCSRVGLSTATGKAPRQVCLDGDPTIEEIANDGVEFHWNVRYPSGATCLVSGRVRASHGRDGTPVVGTLDCTTGGDDAKLPSPERPITAEVAISVSVDHPEPQFFAISGLAGKGVSSVGLIDRDGSVVKTPVVGHAYSFRTIPDRDWVALAAFAGDGSEVYREPLSPKRHLGGTAATKQPPSIEPPRRPAAAPRQQASIGDGSLAVYGNGVIALGFASTRSGAYRGLLRAGSGSDITLVCSKLAFGAGHWNGISAVGSAPPAPNMVARLTPMSGREPVSQFDYCESSGTLIPHWSAEGAPHERLEAPFTALGRRYLDERAVAADLSRVARVPAILRARKAIERGERAPGAAEISALLGRRVVPLASPDGSAPSGKIGVWTGGPVIVFSEITREGRRLYLSARGKAIGSTNIRDLASVF